MLIMKVFYKSGNQEKVDNINNMYKLIADETIELIKSITSKNSKGKLLSKKYGYLIKTNVEHGGKKIIIEYDGHIKFLKYLPERVTDVKYLLHFYATSLDKIASLIGEKNNVLTVKQVISVFPELKITKRR